MSRKVNDMRSGRGTGGGSNLPSTHPLWLKAKIKRTTKSGYVVLSVRDPVTGIVYDKLQHVVIWERYWWMQVPEGFCIHHVNGNRRDNRIENLLCLRKTVHSSLHGVHREYCYTGRRSWSDLRVVARRAAAACPEREKRGGIAKVAILLEEGLMMVDPGFRNPPLPLQAIREEADVSRREMGKFLRCVNPKAEMVPHTRINEWEIGKRPIPAWAVGGYACFLVDTWAERRLESPSQADEIDVTFATLLNPGYGHLVKVIQQARRRRIKDELVAIRTLLERGFGENWQVAFGHVWRGVEGLGDEPPVPWCRRYQPDL